MPHKLRKTRWKRGTRTCGYGRVGQHRKTGTKGRRRPGRHKHLWTYVLKYEPDYFGKHGFKSPKSKGREIAEINIGDIEDIIRRLEEAGKLEERDGLPYLDLKALGYDKLLGMGELKRPVVLSVPSFSRKALEKVKAIGGKILSPALEETSEVGEMELG